MIGISKKELINFDPCQYDNQQDLLNAILKECHELDTWMTIDDFLKSRNDGLCWAAITGKVYECHFIKGKFYFGEKEVARVIADNIKHVKPIHKPEPPR